ncbi:membrane protein [Geobacillus phage TP-84]|uniref:Membrane protein n=1 Tax=Geobacillus phage TP-84 TaxID=1965361 RepID=A0A2D1Q781_9CAUD|nr:membrane protein [Geobacillus phage TP-84]ATP06114.1 membrane protein [Geobacillus phage TP-84]
MAWKGVDNMDNERKKGPIEVAFDWTLAIIALATIIGLAWKYILKPLFLG